MRALGAVIAAGIGGCSAPPRATVSPSAPPATTTALAGWPAVTGATYAEYVQQLPIDQAWTLARQLMTEGNVTCTRTRVWCGDVTIDEPRDDETTADACLRRATLRRLVSREGALPDDVLARLTALTTDVDLLEVAAMDRSDDQKIALAAALEHAGTAPSFVSGIAPEAAADAVQRLHLAAAVGEIDGKHDPDVLLAVVADPTYPADVRVDAMFTIEMYANDRGASAKARKAGAELATLASTLVTDPDCAIAAKAAEMRATLANDTRYIPRRPHTGDRAVMLRALCVALHYQGGDGERVLDTFVPAAGLAVVYPDGRPGKRKHKRELDALPRNNGTYGQYDLRNFLEAELGLALDQATGTPCSGDACDEPSVQLSLDPDASGDLVLTQVTIVRNLAGEQRRVDAAAAREAADECEEADGD